MTFTSVKANIISAEYSAERSAERDSVIFPIIRYSVRNRIFCNSQKVL